MIDIKTAATIIVTLLTIGGAIVGFFVMQAKQNMDINNIKKDIENLRTDLDTFRDNQIESDKTVAEINIKLDHILEAIDDLKKARGLK